MSASWINILPTDPHFSPTKEAAAGTLAVAQQIFPDAAEIQVVDSGEIEFVDAGSNTETTFCPVCHQTIDAAWWAGQMDAAFECSCAVLQVVVPCCQVTMSLNDLAYVWPAGFAVWHLSIRNPNVGKLTQEQEKLLSDALQHSIRVVYTRY